MVAATKVGIHDGRHEFGESTEDGSVSHVPSPEARVDIAHGVRQDRFDKFAVGRIGPGRLVRRGCVEARTDLVGHRLPNRPLADRSKISDRVVHHAVCQGAHLVPVLRVERFLVP